MTSSALDRVIERRLDLAWRMLTTLGAPARAQPIQSTGVDPECALVLAAIGSDADARIAEMTRWFLRAAHRSLSISRTRSIADGWGSSTGDALARLGADVADIPELRQWHKAFAATRPAAAVARPDRLAERVGADELAANVASAPGAFRLRLRLGFGNGARTEALAALIVASRTSVDSTQAWMTLPQIERATGFGKRHLLDNLPDMARAGLLDHQRLGRAHQFRLRRGMLQDLGPAPATWLHWPERISTLLHLERSLRDVATTPTLSAVMDARRALTPVSAHIDAQFVPANPEDGSETSVRSFLEWLETQHVALADIS